MEIMKMAVLAVCIPFGWLVAEEETPTTSPETCQFQLGWTNKAFATAQLYLPKAAILIQPMEN